MLTTIARGYNAYKFLGDVKTIFGLQEIIGVNFMLRSLTKLGIRTLLLSNNFDEKTAQKLVDRMRSYAPHDSGRLYNGITKAREGKSWLIEASAVRTTKRGKESADYAYFVERGTRPGRRRSRVSYLSDEGFFSDEIYVRPTTRTRVQYRNHPGTAAQPFFFNSIAEIMGEARAEAAQLPEKAARQEGWELQ